MFIKAIHLKNIRSYTKQSIFFSKGSTLLLGDIGSGKTTILLAIEFALFGIIKGDINGNNLLRNGATEGSVELEFELNNNNIKIMRKLKRKKDIITQDSGHIIINNIKSELTPTELKSKILELLGYPEDLLNKSTSLIYRYTIYTPQEEMKKILFESKEERLDILRRIFNIDKYKRIRENTLIYIKDLKINKKILESKIVDNSIIESAIKENSELLTKNKNELDKINTWINDNKNSLNKLTEEINSIKEKIEDMNNLKTEIAVLESKNNIKKNDCERIEKEINIINYRITEYDNKLKEIGAVDQDEEKIKETLRSTEEKLNLIRSQKELLAERLKVKQNDLKNIIIEDSVSLKLKYEKLKNNIKNIDEKIKSLEEKKTAFNNLIIEINNINLIIINSKKIIDNIKDLNTCPVCLQTVDFNHKINITDRENLTIFTNEKKLEKLREKKEELLKDIQSLNNEIESMRRDALELKTVEAKIENISNLAEKKNELQKEIEEIIKKKEKLDSVNIDILIETISKNRKILNNINLRNQLIENIETRKNDKKRLEEQLSGFKEELIKITNLLEIKKSEIKSFLEVETEFNKKNKEKETITNTIKDLEIKKSLLEKENETILNTIKKLEEDKKNNDNIKNKLLYIENLINWLNEYFINLNSIIEKNIMHKIRIEFEELFKEWFNMIVQDEDFDIGIDEYFSPTIKQNNYQTLIENLSGGEKTAIALAYRLALNKVINDFINNIKTKDIIILDEPTDGFSSEQLDRMREVIDALNVKQLIMVSHEAKMESYVENIIRINKHNHISGII
ncbi:MAG: SMC family ATPase [Candidatus Woesearchaeota archaeon]